MFGNFVEVIATVTTTLIVQKSLIMLCHNSVSQKVRSKFKTKEIEMINRLLVVIAMYCQASSPAVQ